MYKKLTYEEGDKLFHEILESWEDGYYPKHTISFYYPDGKIWIGVDNTTEECWEEEFYSEQECIDWLKEGD